jgi:hypothetical protein
LKLGTLRIESSAEEFAQFNRLVVTAMRHFEVTASDAAVSYHEAITH